MIANPPWWHATIVYQIYPPWSFQDSNEEGIIYLPKIISQFDYLNDETADSLGVDLIWLSKIYHAPHAGFRLRRGRLLLRRSAFRCAHRLRPSHT